MLHQEIKAIGSLKPDEKLIFVAEIKKTGRSVNKGEGKKKRETLNSKITAVSSAQRPKLTVDATSVQKQIPSRGGKACKAEPFPSVKRQLCILPCAHRLGIGRLAGDRAEKVA